MTLFEVFQFLLRNYFLVIVLYITGHSLISFFTPAKNKNIAFYIKIITGLVLLISTYAIIKSGFKSYLITIIPLIISFLFYFRKEFDTRKFRKRFKSVELTHLFFLIVITSVVYFLTIISLVNINGELYEVAIDYPYYAGISEILNKTGIETINWDLAFNNVSRFKFYHYFELWFGAFCLLIFKINSLQSILLLVFVVFASIAVYGVNIILNKENHFRMDYLISSFLILIISPLYRTLRWIIGVESGLLFNQSIISDLSIKTAVVLTLSVLLWYYRKSDTNIITLILLLTAIVYPTTIIMLIPALIVWLIYLWLKYNFSVRQNIYWVLSFVITMVFVVLVNNCLSKNSAFFYENIPERISQPGMMETIVYYFRNNYLKVLFEPFIFLVYQLLSYSLFILLFIFHLRIKNISPKKLINDHLILISFLIFAFLIGSIGRALLGFTENGRQITNNFFHPLFILMSSYLLIKTLWDTNARKLILFSFFIVAVILGLNIPRAVLLYKDPISLNDHLFLLNKLKNNSSELAFVSIKNNNSTYVYYPFAHLRWFMRDYFPSSLSQELLINRLDEKNYEKWPSKYSKYYKDIIVNGKTIPEVIKANQIPYVVIENQLIDSIDVQQFSTFKATQLRDFIFYEFSYQNYQ